MQKWFNKLSIAQSIITTIIFILIGAYFFYLRNTDQIGFGYFIGIGIVIETMILNYKKYLSTYSRKSNDEEE
jgi:hypothetical protein